MGRVYLNGLEPDCRVSRDTRLLVTASGDDQTARIRCGFGTGVLNAVVKAHEPMPLPPNAVVTCTSPTRLDFYLDNGGFCDRFDTNFYEVKRNQTPPLWWPCPSRKFPVSLVLLIHQFRKKLLNDETRETGNFQLSLLREV